MGGSSSNMPMPGIAGAAAVHTAMYSIPEWLGVAGAAVFVAIAGTHLRLMAQTSGQRRPWHGCHVLIALGMAFMYAPAELDPLGVPAGFWRLVFASAGILAALWALGGVGRVPTLLWLLTALDLGAMMYMWSPQSQVAPLTSLLVVYFTVQGGMWAIDAYRRIDGSTPIITWRYMSTAPAGAELAVSGGASESLIGNLDIGVSMIAMTLGMAYMLATMVLTI
jgi:hypothetical protein